MVQVQNPQPAVVLPAVDRVLKWPAVEALRVQYGHSIVVQSIRSILAELREQIRNGVMLSPEALQEQSLAEAVAARLRDELAPALKRVFNLTGTVLHTNLGRALLPAEALVAVQQAATEACNLEYDLATGERGERDSLVEALLRELTGAEAALVVNNNAAAVLLTLNALAARKDVIVSRGELIEIGGSFRIPEIMARAGCRLCEIGTTNRTHAHDYEGAIDARTGLVLKVHTSNYVVQGFTTAVDEKKLAQIAHARELPFVVDLGSGTLIDLAQYGLPKEPTPQESLAHGADLVTFSGDKLLGGPQAGIIVGRADLVKKIKRNPLKRALRVDKMTLAALEAVLRLYRQPELLRERLPTLRLLTRPVVEIEALAARLQPAFALALGDFATVEITHCESQIGSGSLPIERLASAGLAIRPYKKSGAALSALAEAFRALPMPMIGAVADGALRFDLRCLEDEGALLAQMPHLKLKGVPT